MSQKGTVMPAAETTGRLRRVLGCLAAIVRQRCPRCWTGRMFRGSFTMNDPCPVCGLVFERDEGYFVGALYFSYALSSALLITFYVVAYLLFPDWNSIVLALVAVVPYLPFMPAVYRYSRVLWVYLDRAAWPSELSADPSAKPRRR